jgi:hypothetical protein
MSASLRLSPFDLYIDPLLAFQDARLKELHAYWAGKRQGRAMPARADVHPAEIISHLPSVFLIGAEQGSKTPQDFRVRLMGTALNELFGLDLTRETLADGLEEAQAALGAKVLAIVCELRRPLRLHGRIYLPGRPGATPVEAALFPLSATGAKVDMLLGWANW